jgi:cation diffusion facilitator CzcD-associated flavoprotein CzcO
LRGDPAQRAGIHDFTILEKADRVGGTWRDNTYPGAACDVPLSHLYSYSFEPNARWQLAPTAASRRSSRTSSIARPVRPHEHLSFGSEVVGCEYDEASGTWCVTTKDGRALVGRALILGNGALHMPRLPELPGLETFAGKQFHSARWDHSYDLTGKRVAVIGTGASSIQFVPEIAQQVEQLEVFQRSPPWIMPKPDRPIGSREQWMFEHLPGAHWLRRTGLYWLMESRVLGFAFAPRIN